METAFTAKGSWYKGNLHSHTTISDGTKSPEDVIRLYKTKTDLSFLAITDHNVYSDFSKYSTRDFIVLPGVEVSMHDLGARRLPKGIHVLAIAKYAPTDFGEYKRFPPEPDMVSFQHYLDYLSEHGMLLFMPHPAWSGFEPDDYIKYNGFAGIEVFNSDSEPDGGRGYSTYHWDYFLRQNIRMLGIATDDGHHYSRQGLDWHNGFICVKAEKLTHENIIDSIQKGLFYASQGPEIYDFSFDENEQTLHAECSPAKSIRFLTYERKGYVEYAPEGKTITSASFRLRDGVNNYCRLEVVDRNNKTAWSQPIYFKDEYDRGSRSFE